jgi:DNA-binding response OmpR family regulator
MFRVLVVDDDPEICRLVEKILSHANFAVDTALDAVSGYDKLTSNRYQVLISDANLPKFSGYHLIQKVRQTHEDMAIIMLTGKKARQDIEKAIDVGVDDYVVKPFDPLTLIKKVEQFSRHAEPLAELDLPSTSRIGAGKVAMKFQILTVMEDGLRILCPWPLKEKEEVDLDCLFLTSIGMPKIKMTCDKIERFVSGEGYYIRILFSDLSERDRSRIIQWMHRHRGLNEGIKL